MTHDITRDLLDELCAGVDTIEVGTTAQALKVRLEQMCEHGDPDAENALRHLLRDGCTKRVRDYAKREHVAPAVTADGRIVSMSMRGGIARRKAESGESVVFFEQTLFERMTWADFADYVGGLIRQVRSLTDQIRVLQRFQDLKERFPDSSGPGEAARLAGTTLEALLQEAS